MRYLLALLLASLLAGSARADAEWSPGGVITNCRYKVITVDNGADGEYLDFGSGSAGWVAPGSRARIIKIRNQGPDNLLWEGEQSTSSVSFSELTTPADDAASDVARLDPDVGSGIEVINGVAWTGVHLQNEDEDGDDDTATAEVWWCY